MAINHLKIIYFGTPSLAEKILSHMTSQGVAFDYVITQPDKPAGRGKKLQPSEVKKCCQEQKIPVAHFEKLDAASFDFFRLRQPDLLLVAAYGLLLPKELLEIPRYGAINIHPSLLPELRGPTPIQTALLQGKKETGLSIMLMDDKMDTGPVLTQEKIAINLEDNYDTLEDKLVRLANHLLIPTIEKWTQGTLQPSEQDNRKATYTKMIEKKDGQIKWTDSAEGIYHHYQAFYRWPKIFTFWKDQRLPEDSPAKKVTLLEIAGFEETTAHHQPGQIYLSESNDLMIMTGQGALKPTLIQLEGKKPMSPNDFINGYPGFVGSTLN